MNPVDALFYFMSRSITNAYSIFKQDMTEITLENQRISGLYKQTTISIYVPIVEQLNIDYIADRKYLDSVDYIQVSPIRTLSMLITSDVSNTHIHDTEIARQLVITYQSGSIITLIRPTPILADTILSIAVGRVKLINPIPKATTDGSRLTESTIGSRTIEVRESLGISPPQPMEVVRTGVDYLYTVGLDELYRLLRGSPFPVAATFNDEDEIISVDITPYTGINIYLYGNPVTSSAISATQPAPITFLGNIGSKRIPIPSPNHQLGRMFLHKWKSA